MTSWQLLVAAALPALACAQTTLASWSFDAGTTASNAATGGTLAALAVHRAVRDGVVARDASQGVAGKQLRGSA
jgi:hypothetical protein